MAFSDIKRPTGLKDLISPRNPANKSGFQGAHVAGDKFWQAQLNWLTQNLGADFNPDNRLNGVLLPEGNRGGAVLGVAEHFGDNVDAFDRLFYDSNTPGSRKYLNVIEERLNLELRGVNDPARIAEIQTRYRIQVRNFLDFVKIQ